MPEDLIKFEDATVVMQKVVNGLRPTKQDQDAIAAFVNAATSDGRRLDKFENLLKQSIAADPLVEAVYKRIYEISYALGRLSNGADISEDQRKLALIYVDIWRIVAQGFDEYSDVLRLIQKYK